MFFEPIQYFMHLIDNFVYSIENLINCLDFLLVLKDYGFGLEIDLDLWFYFENS